MPSTARSESLRPVDVGAPCGARGGLPARGGGGLVRGGTELRAAFPQTPLAPLRSELTHTTRLAAACQTRWRVESAGGESGVCG